MTSEVRFDVSERVCVVTIDRPHVRNAIGLRTMGEIEETLAEVSRQDVAVLVITGGGDRAFVSGGDLKELEAIRSVIDAEAMASRMRAILDRLIQMPMPVIAALNGHTYGGGAEVAVACDIRVAANDVKIGFTQSQLGIMAAWGGVERLTELVGRSRAIYLMCTGRAMTAAEAAQIGLVDEVLPRSGFDAGWRALAARIARLPTSVTRSIKASVVAVRPGVHPETQARAVHAFAELWAAPDHWELAAAEGAGRRRRPPDKDGAAKT